MTTPPEPPQGDAWQNAPRMSPEQNAPQYGSPPPPGGPPGYGGGGGGYGGPPGYGGPQRGTSNGMGIAALVLGILGFLSSWMVFGVIFSLLAIIFGFIGRGKAKRGDASNGGMALAGIILGVIGVLITVLVIAVLGQFLDEATELSECLEKVRGDRVAEEACNQRFADQVSGS